MGIKIKVGECETKINDIDEFVRHTLNSDTLGCDKEFIRTNMFNANESILLAHGWNADIAPIRFRDFCKNGKEHLQDYTIPLIVEWDVLYNKYYAYMFSQHIMQVAHTKSTIQYRRLQDDEMGFVECITSFGSGYHNTFHTDFFLNKEDK